ncbi:MFS transporter [Gulosibacter chungangensis]|uniref:MFS transporter n=1 Tax=Gulosibacter chungangensis TaxID=979746 RepID=A0A7J5BFQ0_9MICO|nr:MFS transporter [Gulosibacter chungangensis]KAB1645106.1 MFS transporter [Gulosibacter chungangensis]
MSIGTGSVRGDSSAAIVVLSAATGTFAILLSIVGPAIPVMQRALGTDQLGANWIMTAYLLSAAVMTPVVGRLGDSLGKKQVLIAVLLLLVLGCVVAALANDLWVMIVGRVIQGAGGGAFPLAFGFLRDHLEGRRLTHAIGAVAGFGAACVGLGGVLSGIIVELVGYQWIFWAPAMVLLAATAVVAALPRSPKSKATISPLSVLLFALGLGSFLLVVNQSSNWGFASTPTLLVGLLATGGIVSWIWSDRRASGPLIDMGMMVTNVMWTTSLSAALLGIGLYGLQTFIPQFVQTSDVTGYGLGLSVMESGLVMLPMALGMFVTGFTSARFVDWFGVRRVLAISPAVAGVGVLFLIPTPTELWQVLVASGLAGLGIGLAFSVMPAVVVSGVSAHQSGIASGINANLRTVGGAVGTALIAAIVTPGVAGEVSSAEDYQMGFVVISVAAFLSAGVGFFTNPRAGN